MRLIIFLSFLYSTSAIAANRYWVSSTSSNWNNTANWSATSGGAAGSSVPGIADIVFFDGIIGEGNCTFDMNVSVLGIYINGFSGSIVQGSRTLTVSNSGYSQSSGIFEGGNSNIIVSGSGTFVLTGGSFESTSAILTIRGTRNTGQILFNQTGGVFRHNNGTLHINPANGCAAVTHTIDVIPGTEFYNVVINATNTCGNIPILITAAGDVMTVINELTHSDGAINGLISLQGNLIVTSGADPGTGMISIEGVNEQTYTFTGTTPRTCGITVNKPSENFTPVLGTTQLFVTRFVLQSGKFIAPSGQLNIGGTWNSSQVLFDHSGGIFDHNKGTLSISPLNGCAAVTHTLDVIPTTEFYDVIINANNTCGNIPVIITAVGDVINATNNLTHSNGMINGSFSVKNDLFVDAGADAGSGSITFDGSVAQTYTIAAGSSRTCGIVVNKPSGSVAPAVGTTQFQIQKFNLLNGDFTAPSGQMNIGGTWNTSQVLFNHSSGTFKHNNGTLTINTLNGCAAVTHTLDVIPTTEFYNVTINANNTCGNIPIIITAVGDIVNATNNFTHSDGMINGLFSVKKDLFIDAGSDAGTGTITFDGSGAQAYTVAAGSSRTCGIVVNKQSGTVVPAMGTTQLLIQKFSLLSGDFMAPTGQLNIGGTWNTSQVLFNHAGGIFNHNNGTLTINPLNGCAAVTHTIDVIPATDFYNVIINANNTCGNIPVIVSAVGDIVNATNNFTHSDGMINGLFSVKKDLFIDAGSDAGTGTITFDGSGVQTYTVAAGSPRTCGIVVNKLSGTVVPTVGTTQLLIQKFSLLSGDFTAPSSQLNIGGTWNTSQILFNHAGGIFNHNNGTLIINPLNGCAAVTHTLDVIPTTDFYNVIINANNTCGNIPVIISAVGDVVNATNNFTHSDGMINGLFSVKKDLFIDAGSDAGTGTITFEGNGGQTYTVAAGSPRTCGIVVNKPSGSVSPAVGTTQFPIQKFSLLAGDFIAPSGQLNIGGTWNTSQVLFNHASGTYRHNNGTLIINPLNGCAAVTHTLDVIPATDFYNVTINANNTCGNIPVIISAVGDVINATNNLTHSDGMINGLFSVKKDLFIDTGSDAGTGTITFDGTAAQMYTVAAGSPRTCGIVVNKPSGTVVPAVGTTQFMIQKFSLLSGDFTSPTGQLNIGGTWNTSQTLFNHSSGTYRHNNGTLTINPLNGCAAVTHVMDVIPTTEFFNVTINATNTCGNIPNISIAVNDTIHVLNDLRLTRGRTINRFIDVIGNVIVESTYDPANTSEIILIGSGNTTFDATNAVSIFDGRIKINKSNASRTVTLLSALQLDAASQSITFVKGRLISTTSNLLIIGNGVTALSASDSSHVSGPVRKIGNAIFAFPVGKIARNGVPYYRPVSISAPGNVNDHYTAEYFPNDTEPQYNSLSKDLVLDHVSRCEYWMLDRTNGISNVSVTLSWKDSTSCGVTNLSNLRVARWDGVQWRDHGNGSTTGTINSGTIQSSGVVTSFGPFALSSSSRANPLPVSLISFVGACDNSTIKIKWTTGTETNNDFFNIERSADAITWKSIGTIKAAGNSNDLTHYEFQDKDPSHGESYYRLEQTDLDGKFEYLKTIFVSCSSKLELDLSVYPNPSTGMILIKNSFDKPVVVYFSDMLGKQLISIIIRENGDELLDLTTLRKGMYIMKYTIGQNARTQKLTIN